MKEQLRQYIENAFSGALKTPRNEELKEEVLANLFEKYDDLLASGMTEEEAYRATVKSVGDLSSLFEKATQEESASNGKVASSESELIPLYDEQTCAKKQLLRVTGIACAVMLYILSLFPVILLENEWGVAGMFFLVAVATGAIVFLESTKPILVDAALTEEQITGIRKKRTVSAAVLAASILLYILCVCPVLLIPNEKLGVLGMFFLIGVATVTIILRASLLSMSAILHQTPYQEDIKAAKVPPKKSPTQLAFSIISGIYWAIICLLYFIYSFYTLRWEASWLIFVYGGLAYLIAHGIFSLVIGRHRAGSIVKIVICSILLFAILSPALLTPDSQFPFNLGSSSMLYDDSEYQQGGFAMEPEISITELNIDWVEGDVVVLYWDEDYISVSEASDSPHTDSLRYRLDGSRLTIKFRESHFIMFGNSDTKDLTVSLPRGTALDELAISNVSGDIRVTLDTCGSADFDNVSGELFWVGSATEFDMDTVSGKGDLHFTNMPRSVDLDSVSAAVTVRYPKEISGFEVEFDSVSGSCHCPLETERQGDTYLFGNGESKINFDSVSGSLTVELVESTLP